MTEHRRPMAWDALFTSGVLAHRLEGMITLPWVSMLRDELNLEYGDGPRVAQLATVDERGRPQVRSVVCRRIGDGGTLFVASDGRSAKNLQLRARPETAWVFWLAGRRKQFRLSGGVRVIDASADPDARSLREAIWREISDAARALFVWPASGRPRERSDTEFATGLEKNSPRPASFELLVATVEEAEMLDLNPHPHARMCWRVADGWLGEAINP